MSAGVSTSRKVKLAASAGVSLAIMVVIFLMSGQNGEESGSLSEAVSRFIAPLIISGFDAMSPLEQLEWIEVLSWPIRKAAHGTEYACLGISLLATCWQARALWSETRKGSTNPARKVLPVAVVAFLLTVLYACSDELHQLLIDGRAGQLFDVCVDASGAAVGILLCSLIMYAYMRKRSSIST